MNRILSTCLFLLALIPNLALAQAATEDTTCDIIFAGPSASVSIDTQGIGQGETQLLSLSGYIQCRRPVALGWNSFANPGADSRYLTIILAHTGANVTPEIIKFVEQRLKDCHRMALLALSNPAKYSFYIGIHPARYSSPIQQNALGASLYIEGAQSIGCSLGINSTGLR